MTIPLHWYRIGLTLVCTYTHPHRRAHPLAICEAIVKGISESLGLMPPHVRTVFRWVGVRCTQMRLTVGSKMPLEILLFGVTEEEAQRWHEGAKGWFDSGAPGRNFTVFESTAPQQEDASTCMEAVTIPDECDEIVLDFLTPLPFVPTQGRSRTWIDGAGFMQTLVERLRRLFGDVPLLPPVPQVIPAYWEYCQIEHASQSQKGHIKYLNGCTGPLLLRGPNLRDWLPWLALFERIGAGSRISFGQGLFRLLSRSRPVLDAALTDPNQIRKLLEMLTQTDPEALRRLGPAASPEYLAELAAHIAGLLRAGHTPQPFEAVSIPRDDGRRRRLEIPATIDMVILRHLAQILSGPFDRLFSVHSIGYRKGRSREDAVELIRAALAQGCTYVLESDISDFFPSVDLSRLADRLDAVLPQRDQRLRQTVHSYLHAPWQMSGQLPQARSTGLPLGSPLSPLLANFYLDGFDDRLSEMASGAHLIRYADDFVILTQSQADAERLLIGASDAAAAIGLELNTEKTAIRPVSEGFHFLGIHFAADAVGEQAGNEQADTSKKILYLTEPYAFVGLDHESIKIEAGGRLLGGYPLARTRAVVALVPCSLSSQVIVKLTQKDIPITLADGQARQMTTLAGDSARRFERAARQAEHHTRLGEAGRKEVAARWVEAKLANYIALIEQRGTAGSANLVHRLRQGIVALHTAENVDVIRGIEGQCAQATFPFITGWINNPDFPWLGRRRHGEQPDRLNSLLNFGYHLLFTRINALLRVHGLNPYLGFLHEANGRYEALACDLQEPFRPYIDRLIIRLVNLRAIQAGDFIETAQGWWLTAPARNTFLRQFAREMERRPIRRQFSISEYLEWQIEVLLGWIMKDQPLTIHHWKKIDE